MRILVLRDELRFVHVGRAVHEDAAVAARANLLGELHAIVEAGLVGRRIAGEPRVMKIENERVGFGLVVVGRHEEAVWHRHAAELEDSTLEALVVIGSCWRRSHRTSAGVSNAAGYERQCQYHCQQVG